MKTAIKIIICVALVAAGWYLSVLLNKAKDRLPDKSPIARIKEKEIQTEAAEISKEVGKNGLQHTIYKMVKEIDQSAVDAVKADLLDTVAALGIARDKLKQVMVINTNLTINNQKLEKKVSELATTYTHADDYFRLAVNIPKDSLESATFNLGYDADLIAAQYNKRKWLFWNDPLINIYSNDPRFTNKGLRSFTVRPKEPVFALKVEAKAAYNNFAGPSGGPGASLRVGRFTLTGDYQYYTDFNKWAFGYGAAYRLIGTN